MHSRFLAHFLAACLLGTLLVTSAVHADETIGSPLINRNFDGDGASGVEVISLQGFTQPGTLTSWSFFNNNPNLALPVTPFVALRTAPNTYQIAGIGRHARMRAPVSSPSRSMPSAGVRRSA